MLFGQKNKRSYCCEKCQKYWICETKWYRGEKGEENVCCPLCVRYASCGKSLSPFAWQSR